MFYVFDMFVFVHFVLLGFIYLRRNLQCYNKNALNLMESDIHINSNFKVEEFMGGNKAYIPAKLWYHLIIIKEIKWEAAM